MQHYLSWWWEHVLILKDSAFICLVQTSWGWQSQTVWDSLWCCKMMDRQIAWRKGVTGIFTSSPPQIFPSGISQHNDVNDVIKLGKRIWMGSFSPLLNFVSCPQIVISKCLQFISGRGCPFSTGWNQSVQPQWFFLLVCLQINSWKDTEHITRFTDQLLCASMLLSQQRNTSE